MKLFDGAYDRLYFSNLRNILTNKQAKFLFYILILILIILVASLPFIELKGSWFLVLVFFSFFHCVLTITFFSFMWCWTYRGTNMMLRPEGHGKWSMHMGVCVSLFPCAYARVMHSNKHFMNQGRIAIAKAAQEIGFQDTIILKGHLYGLKLYRKAKVGYLKNKLPDWKVTHKQTNETLGEFYARSLTRLRNAYLKKSGKCIKGKISKDRKIGIIEFRIRKIDKKKLRQLV